MKTDLLKTCKMCAKTLLNTGGGNSHTSLIAAFLLLLPWSIAMADVITVADGTTYGRYVPLYGNYDDDYQHVQILYPASLLAGMDGSQITSLTFYLKTKATKAFKSTYTISLAEVTNTNVPTSYISTEMTQVYEGLLDAMGETMVVSFLTPYDYAGGNLLFDLKTKTKVSSGYSDSFFYGVNQDANLSTSATNSSSVPSSGTARYFLPKTTFTYEATGSTTCPKPTDLTKGAVTSTSATFSWTAGGEENTWQWVCLPAASAVDWNSSAVQTTTYATATATATGLDANTEYKFYVRAYCGAEEQSADVSAAFKTPCDEVASIASYGFEDVTTGSSVYNIPDCWSRIAYESSYSGTLPYVSSTSEANKGSKCLYFYGGSSTSSSIIVLPPVSSPNTKAISFWYKTSTSTFYGKLQIGYMTDPSDGSTFNILTTLDQAASYTQVDGFVLSGMPSTASIAIRFAGGSSAYGSAYIDDIEVFTPSSCTKPTSLSAVAASATSATVSWTKGGDETAWNLQYRIGSDTWTPVNNILTTVDGTSCTATLPGLAANTTYEIQVQADCGGDQSGWSASANVTTPCEAITGIGFTEDFEGISSTMPDCWDKLSGTGYPSYPNVYSYYGKTAAYSLRFYGGASTSNEIAILPVFTEDINILTISFYYYNGSWYTGDNYASPQVGYITDIKNASTFTAVATLDKLAAYAEDKTEVAITGAPTGARIAIRYGGGSSAGYLYIDDIEITRSPSCFKPASVTVNSTTYNSVNFSWVESGHGEEEWQYAVVAAGATPSSWTNNSTKSAIVSSLTTGTAYEVCVRSYCDAEDQSDFIRSASFTPTCQVPTAVAVSGITNNSAVVAWTANNGESKWNLQYKLGSAGWTTVENITDNPYTLTGLDANSSYTVQVACAEGCTSGYSTIVSFNTKCNAVDELPYNNDFEGETTSKMPSCWDRLESGSYPQVMSGSASYGGSGKCLGFYGSGTQTAVLPVFETAVEKLTISFYYKHSYSNLQIGYVKADGTFVSKETLPTRSAYNTVPYEVEMTGWGDEPAYIALRMTNTTSSYASAYVDNVVVKKTPTCFKPATLNAATSITESGATLTWTASGKGETQYQYICVPAGETPDWGTATLTSERTIALTGLDANTSYYFYVRSYCAADDQSEVVSNSFKTLCGTVSALPFTEDFTGLSAVPDCWKTYAATYYSAYASGNELRVSAPKTAGNETVVVLPKLEASLSRLALSFNYKANNGTIEVGYVTNADDKTSFAAVGDALTATTTYTQAIVSLASVSTDAYIAIRFKGNTGDGEFNIDDIRVARTEVFTDTEDNESRFAALAASGETIDVIFNRTMLYNGDYNTLCLPFSLTAAQLANSPLKTFTVKAYDYATIENEELLISIAGAGSIEAGVPYFVANRNNEANKSVQLYQDVVITAATPGKIDNSDVTFQGVFNPVDLAQQEVGGTHDELFLAAGNMIYWPAQNKTVKGFRAYFKVTTGGPLKIRKGMPARIVEHADTATGIYDIQGDQVQSTKALENGQVVIIRNGVKYSITGQKIQ